VTRVLLVDWLGRGGIAQTSESWAVELDAAGAELRVVTRSGRELGQGAVRVVGPAERGNALLSHVALCRFAAAEIRAWRPDVVIIQNYVIPAVEQLVHRAAAEVGAEVVMVVHDHRHHERREGGHLGLRRQLARADRVVVHSHAVGAGLDVPFTFVPLPVQLGMVDADGRSPISAVDGRLLALQVGVLNRAYKGVETTLALAAEGVPGWAFAFAGVGAPTADGVHSVDRFLDAGELRAAMTTADAILLPYRHATQSGAVVLAQLYGVVPVATAVDGLVEQIDDGVTGLLVPAAEGLAGWRAALERLADDAFRRQVARQAQEAVWRQHEGFRVGVRAVVGIGGPTDGAEPVPY
jgi:glycosyltransferase involved in cell wall biosynthesis